MKFFKINIYVNEVNIVGFFRNFDLSKNGVNFNRKNCFRRKNFSIKFDVIFRKIENRKKLFSMEKMFY